MKTYLLAIVSALVAIAMNISSAELSDAEWAELKRAAKERQRHVIYDNDDDDLLAFPKSMEPTPENYLSLRTSYLAKYPVDTMVVNATYGAFQQLVFPSENGDLADFSWGEDATGMNLIPYFLAKGIDAYALQIDFARKHGIEFFAGIRINDTHDYADTPEKPVPYFSPWKRNHPEFLMGSHTSHVPFATWSSYDFTHQEVRDKFVAIATEIAEKYPIDGLSIDLFRWMGTFKSVANGEEASEEEVEMFSEMFRRIRRNTEAIGRRRGRPILMAVRVPDSQEFCRGIGFDWEGLMREGVLDIIYAAGNFHLNEWRYSVELCHKYGVKCYADVDMPSFSPVPRLDRFITPAYHARSAGAFAQGVDGIYYFNLFSHSPTRLYMLGGADKYRLKDKRYYICDRSLSRCIGHLSTGAECIALPELGPQRHAWLRTGHTLDFVLEFGDDLAALTEEGHSVEVTAAVLADLPDWNGFTITSNGVQWEPLSRGGDVLTFKVPHKALLPGANRLTIRNNTDSKEDSYINILSGKVLLKGDAQPPWRRIFLGNKDNSRAEAIVGDAYRIKDTGNGVLNLIYPFDELRENIDLEFEMYVDESTAPLGAMMRVACAGKVEIVTFETNRVGFHYAGRSVEFPAGDDFHRFRLYQDAKNIKLSVDDVELLAAPMVADANTPETDLQGGSLYVPGMNENSIVVGSLSDEGAATSFWRNVALLRGTGDINLKDLAVDVRIDARELPEIAWKKSNTGENTLVAGYNAYKCPVMVAEADIEIDGDKPVHVAFSDGGVMTHFLVHADRIEFFGKNASTMPFTPGRMPLTVRVKVEAGKSTVMVNGTETSLPSVNVSGALQESFMAEYQDGTAEYAAIRNSGIAILGDGKAAAMRVAFPE